MSDYQVWDIDDFASSHIISDQCQSHDCRDALYQLREANSNFKVTLFTIPGEMTPELYNWAGTNSDWVELSWHGFYHTSNYECETMDYAEFTQYMNSFSNVGLAYVKGFKAPGWQISNDIYRWLVDRGWWVADQAYNDERRPKDLKVYKVGENSVHLHAWNCVGNGIYETLPQLLEKVKETNNFKFISEII